MGLRTSLKEYTPMEPLRPGTTYTVKIMADGVEDISGNNS